MKVCTDSCLFGAWVAQKVESLQVENVLDIGTGTGLLSLMIAQKSSANIHAVEIDELAASQAKENFEQSGYSHKLQLFNVDITQHTHNKNYQVIIANPPFYENDLKGQSMQRNLALHSDTLSYEKLLATSVKLSSEDAIVFVLLPFAKTNSFITLATKYRLYCSEKVFVKQTEKHDFFRTMLLFTKVKSVTQTTEMTIKEQGKYTDQFSALLKDYYLYL